VLRRLQSLPGLCDRAGQLPVLVLPFPKPPAREKSLQQPRLIGQVVPPFLLAIGDIPDQIRYWTGRDS
jgi:hypothetical protein